MTVDVRTDLADAVGGAMQIVVSEQGAQTTVGLEGEWGLAEREAIRLACAEPWHASRTVWCSTSPG
jgi:hypothetical protein